MFTRCLKSRESLLGLTLLVMANARAANPLPDGPGRKLVGEICGFCHSAARIKDHAYTREEWSSVIKGMISEGAPVTDEEFSLILDYLAKNFGPTAEREDKEKR
jgi:hypothetical protein